MMTIVGIMSSLICGGAVVNEASLKRRCANVCGSRYRSTPFQISSTSSYDCSKTSACQSDCVAFESDVEVDCGGTSSCQGAAFWCGKGHTCEIACSGLSSCGSSLQLFGQWVGHTTRKPSRHPRHDEPAFEHYELCTNKSKISPNTAVTNTSIVVVNPSTLNKNVGIEYRTDGWCDGWITVIEDCSAAAVKLGLSRPGVVAKSDGHAKGYSGDPPVGRLVGRLGGWLVGRYVGCLLCLLVGRLVGRSVGR